MKQHCHYFAYFNSYVTNYYLNKLQRDVIEDAEGNYEPLRDQKGGIENPDIFWHFIKVGRSCTEKLAKNRPEMVQVLKAFDLFISQQNTQASSISKFIRFISK